jgi:hypothetical protein
LRPAVDQKFQRIFLVRIKFRRLDHETLHVFVIRAFNVNDSNGCMSIWDNSASFM